MVISESPIVVTRPDSVNFAFGTLTDAQKTLFMSFSQSPATSVGRSTQSTADRIFRNNAYLWHPAQHPDLAGIFPTLPRFNHHCSPTLTYQTDHAAGKGTFVAIVPAGAGQELCTSYCERVHIRRVRQKQLHETCKPLIRSASGNTLTIWSNADGFTCACSTCSLPEAAQKESDLRRFASRLLDEAVMKPLSKTDRLRSLHLRLRLLREEGLPGPDCARSLNDAVQVCEHEQGERSSDANDANEALAGYAKLAAAEYVRGGNFGEAAEIESTLKKKGQSSTKNAGSQEELKELWARLDSLDALDYETQEAREEWEEAQVEAARGELERISS